MNKNIVFLLNILLILSTQGFAEYIGILDSMPANRSDKTGTLTAVSSVAGAAPTVGAISVTDSLETNFSKLADFIDEPNGWHAAASTNPKWIAWQFGQSLSVGRIVWWNRYPESSYGGRYPAAWYLQCADTWSSTDTGWTTVFSYTFPAAYQRPVDYDSGHINDINSVSAKYWRVKITADSAYTPCWNEFQIYTQTVVWQDSNPVPEHSSFLLMTLTLSTIFLAIFQRHHKL